ncbi:MAG TPA: GNAT family N-acetyltransferase [Chloroflexia bacterium]|jgi:ribosomal protein S18 acetylase RimI-like enzyme
MNITLRPIEQGDMEFLYRAYSSTREMEMAMVDWTDEQKQAFLQMQFSAQHSHYQQHYTTAAFLVILADGQPAGRLYVDRWEDQIRIVDILVVPEYRNAGIGTALLKALIAEGAQSGKPVTIHVEQYNPALRLYERLGFTRIAERGVYYLMECRTGALEAPEGSEAPEHQEIPGDEV